MYRLLRVRSTVADRPEPELPGVGLAEVELLAPELLDVGLPEPGLPEAGPPVLKLLALLGPELP